VASERHYNTKTGIKTKEKACKAQGYFNVENRAEYLASRSIIDLPVPNDPWSVVWFCWLVVRVKPLEVITKTSEIFRLTTRISKTKRWQKWGWDEDEPCRRLCQFCHSVRSGECASACSDYRNLFSPTSEIKFTVPITTTRFIFWCVSLCVLTTWNKGVPTHKRFSLNYVL
jgi:hypothetical protein